jgi:hypothetical protein
MNSVFEFAAQDKATLILGSAWITRESHIWWPRVKLIYPWLKQEGGCKAVLRNIFIGQPKTNP